MSEPDHVVIRPAADLPAGFLPAHLDGLWLDRSEVPFGPVGAPGGPRAVAVPTGRFEARDSDGAVAEVFEVQP